MIAVKQQAAFSLFVVMGCGNDIFNVAEIDVTGGAVLAAKSSAHLNRHQDQPGCEWKGYFLFTS